MPTWHELFFKKFCPSWTEFLKSTFRQVGVKLQPHIQSSWSEVPNLTSVQLGHNSKITSTQLAEKSVCNFYSDCVDVKSAKSKALTFLQLVPLALLFIWFSYFHRLNRDDHQTDKSSISQTIFRERIRILH